MEKCIKDAEQFMSKNGTVILISAGVGMASGVALGMLLQSGMSKQKTSAKKVVSLALSALSDVMEQISDNI